MGSSEETCEGYARIAASLTKHTKQETASFLNRHSRKTCKEDGRQLRKVKVSIEKLGDKEEWG